MRSARGKVAKCSPVFAGFTAATMSTFVNELSPSDRAAFTARRKEAYEALHPESKHGGDRRTDQVDNLATRSFSEDQAEKTGQSARGVRRDAKRGEKVCDKALRYLVSELALDQSATGRGPHGGCGPGLLSIGDFRSFVSTGKRGTYHQVNDVSLRGGRPLNGEFDVDRDPLKSEETPKGCAIPGREGAGQISGAFSIGTGAGAKIPAFTYQRI